MYFSGSASNFSLQEAEQKSQVSPRAWDVAAAFNGFISIPQTGSLTRVVILALFAMFLLLIALSLVQT
jgi:hypothetical protein